MLMIDQCNRVRAAIALIGFGIFAATPVTAGQRQTTESVAMHRRGRPANALPAIRLNVRMVLVPVTVTDQNENMVLGLQKQDFRVLDEGVQQEISEFYRDEAPISVGIIFDSSNSMERKIEISRKAISAFVSRCAPEDEFLLIRFSSRAQEMQAFTRETPLIEDALAHIQPGGWTALFDAVHLGMNAMKRAANSNKVLLVLSDGGDNNSRYSEDEIASLIKEADVRLFAISFFNRAPALEDLAAASGGRAYRLRQLEELPELATKISEELHNEYVLGFTPPESAHPGKYRRLTVQLKQKLNSQPMRASWRPGYYAAAK
jgi:VWFA-related protein